MNTIVQELLERTGSHSLNPKHNKAKSHLIKTLSSQLQLPLNQLIQFANIALQRIRRKQTQLAGDYLVEIKWISEELLIYINDLLELTELKSGESEFALEEIDTVYFLEAMRRQFQPIADNKNITFSLSSDIENPCVSADYSKLAKVLNILLRNAFRNSPEKGLVKLHAQQKSREIFLKICSQNPDPASFSSTDIFHLSDEDYLESREGLMDFSLSICKELMLGQNGNVTLEEGQGDFQTRFILSLPVAQSILD